jgi:DNA-binding beta-propeller fold protein YncE
MFRPILFLAIILAYVTSPSCADVGTAPSKDSLSKPTQIYYTYLAPEGGGIAAVSVHPQTGKIIGQQSLGQDACFSEPYKIAVSPDGRYVAATSHHQLLHNVMLVDLQTKTHQLLSTTETPDAVEPYGSGFFIGADSGRHYFIDAPSAQVTRRWNGEQHLYPTGRRIEYVSIQPDTGLAWTSWQKDSPSSLRKGSRVVVFDINQWKHVADLPMPRALPHLHLADFKEQGPNPEIIIPSPKTNTLLLSMDLYGGVAMADLDAAARGEWRKLSYHTTAPDETWGTAFPDRALRYPTPNNEFVLIANAGKTGGVAWVDLNGRRVVQTLETPPGLEAPVAVNQGKLIVAAALGKTKFRQFGALKESRHPTQELFLFTPSGPADHPRLSLKRIALPTFAYRVAAVAPQANDIVLLTAGDTGPKEIMTVRASTGQVIDRQPALGTIRRIASAK